MNKLYSIALSLLIVSGSSFLDAKKPRHQKNLNKDAIDNLLKRRYADLDGCTFPDTYLGCDRDYIKEDTRGSKRGILADRIAKKYKK